MQMTSTTHQRQRAVLVIYHDHGDASHAHSCFVYRGIYIVTQALHQLRKANKELSATGNNNRQLFQVLVLWSNQSKHKIQIYIIQYKFIIFPIISYNVTLTNSTAFLGALWAYSIQRLLRKAVDLRHPFPSECILQSNYGINSSPPGGFTVHALLKMAIILINSEGIAAIIKQKYTGCV